MCWPAHGNLDSDCLLSGAGRGGLEKGAGGGYGVGGAWVVCGGVAVVCGVYFREVFYMICRPKGGSKIRFLCD